MNWLLERFDRDVHERSGFDCGNASLNDFIRHRVSQYERRRVGRTYVLVPKDEQRIVGYYTLASGQLQIDDLPDEVARKLARHPVPVILLARLAVDRPVQGQKLGGYLLRDALKRCVGIADVIGVFAVFVEAIDDAAAGFYERFGFQRLKNQPHRLFIRIETLAGAA